LVVLISTQTTLLPILLSLLFGITLLLTAASGLQYAHMGYKMLE
jgi:hypothetical protein